jgi:hypothetical protein
MAPCHLQGLAALPTNTRSGPAQAGSEYAYSANVQTPDVSAAFPRKLLARAAGKAFLSLSAQLFRKPLAHACVKMQHLPNSFCNGIKMKPSNLHNSSRIVKIA